MKYLLAALFLTLSSCAFDSDNNRDDKRDLTEREKLVREYSQIQGVYEGTITRANNDVQCTKLIITYIEKIVGRDDQGRPQFRPSLIARLSRPELLVLDNRLEGHYVEQVGDITLTTVQNGGESLYIRGTRSGESFSAPILNASGSVYGYLSLIRKTSAVPPDNREDLEQYERIRNRLRVIAGAYDARFESDDGTYETDIETFRIDIVDDGSIPRPVLSWRRADFVMPLNLPIVYSPDLNPEEIYFTSKDINGIKELFTFSGTRDKATGIIEGRLQYSIRPGTLIAKPHNPVGKPGDYLPEWCQNPGAPAPTPIPPTNPPANPPTTPPQENERTRLVKELKKLEGNYQAQFVSKSGKTQIDLETFRFDVDEKSSTPRLVAYWKSPRASKAMSMVVEYDPYSKDKIISFSSKNKKFEEDVAFEGKQSAQDGSISGKMTYERKNQEILGTFRATR